MLFIQLMITFYIFNYNFIIMKYRDIKMLRHSQKDPNMLFLAPKKMLYKTCFYIDNFNEKKIDDYLYIK